MKAVVVVVVVVVEAAVSSVLMEDLQVMEKILKLID